MKKRKIVQVALKGLNCFMPEHIVEDGFCERLHNLRYGGGVWRSVASPHIMHHIQEDNGYRIIYRHPVLPQGWYIARREGEGEFIIEVVRLFGEIMFQAQLAIYPQETELSLSHFGNVLFLTAKDSSGTVTEKSFLYKDKRYYAIHMGQIAPPQIEMSGYSIYSSDMEVIQDRAFSRIAYVETTDRADSAEITAFENYYPALLAGLQEQGAIPGLFFFFVAYKMYDGTVIKNSQLYTCAGTNSRTRDFMLKKEGNNKYTYYTHVRANYLTLKFTDYAEVSDNPLIKSVCVYATRNYPLYTVDGIFNDFDYSDAEVTQQGTATYYLSRSKCIWNKELEDIIDTPFYEIAELDIKNLAENDTLKLTYKEHFSGIEHKPVYSAGFSDHDIIGAGGYEYNNRWHLYNVTTTLFEGSDQFYAGNTLNNGELAYSRIVLSETADSRICFVVTLNIGGKRVVTACTPSETYYFTKKVSGAVVSGEFYIVNGILSYPDSRAEKMEIYFRHSENGYRLVKSYLLKSAYSNNYAYCRCSDDCNPVLVEELTLPVSGISRQLVFDRSFTEPGKLMVSGTDNPFYYAPEHCYTVESDAEIVFVDSNAGQLTESRFGQHPLLLFTDRGIFALEQGEGELLYASVVPLLDDVVRPGTVSLSTQGVVFYVTGRGLMALAGRKSRCVSQPLGNDFTEKYLIGAKFVYVPAYNELLVYNKGYDYAYICSMEEGVWSTRDLKGELLNGGLFLTETALCNFGVSEDKTERLPAEVVTSPLKMGDSRYKRVETVALRMDYGRETLYTFALEGSADGKNWALLQSGDNSSLLRRTPVSCRFFRLRLSFLNSRDAALTGFDVEYYSRFGRHLQ